MTVQAAKQPHSRIPGEDDGDLGPPPPWGLVWLEDFLERAYPPPEWLYLDLVQKRTTCVIMAPPNAGKTLLAFEMGGQIVASTVGSGPDRVRAALIEQEGSGGACQQRLRRAFNAAGGIPRHAVKVTWNSGRELTNREDLEELAVACAGADLIVLDSLSDLSDTDENDPREMKRLGKALRLLQTLTGATVIALHHMTKEAWKPHETPSLRHLRGHGALAGKVDTVLALVPGDDEVGFVNFDLYCLKQRDAEKARPRHVTVCMTGPAATVEMTPFVSLKAPEPSIDDLVLAALPTNDPGLPIVKLARAIHRRDAAVTAALARLAAVRPTPAVRRSGQHGWVRSSGSSRLVPDVPEEAVSSSDSSRGLNPDERTSSGGGNANAA